MNRILNEGDTTTRLFSIKRIGLLLLKRRVCLTRGVVSNQISGWKALAETCPLRRGTPG